MKVYKLTEQQKELLIGKMYIKDVYFNPILDSNNNWIISETEIINCELEEFKWIKDLEQIEYMPLVIDL